MIIIEGADQVGKTTFAKRLADVIGYKYEHISRLPDDFHRFHDYLPLIKHRVVKDRFHMSEIAYSFARCEDVSTWRLTQSFYIALDRMLLKRAAVIVVLTAEDHVLVERYNRDPDREMYDLATVLRANAAYREIVKGNFEGYSPFVHLHLHMQHVDDYPGNDMIDMIKAVAQPLQAVASYLSATKELYPGSELLLQSIEEESECHERNLS